MISQELSILASGENDDLGRSKWIRQFCRPLDLSSLHRSALCSSLDARISKIQPFTPNRSVWNSKCVLSHFEIYRHYIVYHCVTSVYNKGFVRSQTGLMQVEAQWELRLYLLFWWIYTRHKIVVIMDILLWVIVIIIIITRHWAKFTILSPERNSKVWFSPVNMRLWRYDIVWIRLPVGGTCWCFIWSYVLTATDRQIMVVYLPWESACASPKLRLNLKTARSHELSRANFNQNLFNSGRCGK